MVVVAANLGRRGDGGGWRSDGDGRNGDWASVVADLSRTAVDCGGGTAGEKVVVARRGESKIPTYLGNKTTYCGRETTYCGRNPPNVGRKTSTKKMRKAP